jgi:hypothetical protein
VRSTSATSSVVSSPAARDRSALRSGCPAAVGTSPSAVATSAGTSCASRPSRGSPSRAARSGARPQRSRAPARSPRCHRDVPLRPRTRDTSGCVDPAAAPSASSGHGDEIGAGPLVARLRADQGHPQQVLGRPGPAQPPVGARHVGEVGVEPAHGGRLVRAAPGRPGVDDQLHRPRGRWRRAPATATGTYDLVAAFECIHDLPDPVGVLGAMRRLAGERGIVLVMDERVAETFTAPGDEVEQLMNGYSPMCCLPDGMAHAGSAATGTVMRPDTLRRYARAATPAPPGSRTPRCCRSTTRSSAATGWRERGLRPGPPASGAAPRPRRTRSRWPGSRSSGAAPSAGCRPAGGGAGR